jgi:hypothetical protein
MLERRLRANGIDAFVTNLCSNYERINEIFPEWFDELAQTSPDVVILNYGGAEDQPHIFPTRLLKWIQNRLATPPLGPVSGPFSRLFDRRLRRFTTVTMRRVSPLLGMKTWRLRPNRYERELERVIRVIRGKTGSLVLVMTPSPAAPRLERVLARLNERSQVFAGITRRVTESFNDPSVRLIDVGEITQQLGDLENTLVDGFHFSPEGHEVIAGEMYRAIVEWMDSDAGKV